MELIVNTGYKSFIIYLIYWPPGYVSTDFTHEHSSFLMESESQILPIIYAGDFNIWFDDSSNLKTMKFADTLNIFGSRNHVMETTQKAGDTMSNDE